MSNRKAKSSAGNASNYGPVSSSSSRVPSFKPPAFYAAAAGLKYSPNVDSHTTSELNAAAHDMIDLPGTSSRSYPTSDKGQQQATGRSRSNSSSRPFSRAFPKQQRQVQSSTSESRRRSQMAEIPFLETQLLPSLRDTIDRMTHPPQNNHNEDARRHPSSDSNALRGDSQWNPRSADARMECFPPTPVPSSSHTTANPALSRMDQPPVAKSPYIHNIPKTPNIGASSSNTTPHLDHRSPVLGSSKLPAAVRNASSLRADTTLSPASVSVPSTPRVAYSSGSTPRSARPEALPTSFQSVRSPVSKVRSPNIKSPSKLPIPGSVYAPATSQTPPTPRFHQISSPLQSHPSPRSSQPYAPRYDDYTTDSGSEPEHEYRQTHGSGRLIVANGRISPSSSESTVEHDSRERSMRSAQNIRQANNRRDIRPSPRQGKELSTNTSRLVPPQARDRSIGLGLRLGAERVTHTVSEDRDYAHPHSNQGYPRDSEQRDRQYGGDAYSQPERGQHRESGMSESRRRREALLGLVTGLEHDYGVQPSDTTGSLDQENHSVGGVVMTESMEMEQYAVDGRRHGGDTDKSSGGGTRERRNHPETDVRTHHESHGRSRGGGDGYDRRSSSVPPGTRSNSRPAASPRSQHNSRHEGNVKQSKSRHRMSMSMSMDQSRSGSSHPSSRAKRTSKQGHGPAPSDEGRPTMKRRDSAAREMQAFGIPASLSYGGQDDDGAQHVDPRLTRQVLASDTDVSTVGDDLAASEATTGGLSREAEALFDRISGTGHSARDNWGPPSRSRQQSAADRNRRRAYEDSHARTPQQIHQQHRPLSVAESASAPSVYEPEPEVQQASYDEPLPISSAQDLGTWRSTVRPLVYNQLLDVYGAKEMERQEVVYRFYHAQQELCQRLQSTVRIFVLPLRRQHSKNWIPGVPTRVGRLFDWLEDIVNWHHTIIEGLRDAIKPWDSQSLAVHVAKAIVPFVPRMEVYQPYLVRYEEVRQLVTDHISTPGNEFGEFVKLQQRRKECDGFTLGGLLDLPVAHLSSCINTFEQFWQLTTSEHPDHLAAFSLYHSSRMMLHVLWEVKSREEEYEYVKSISSRIEGLLPSVQLATRERRLLWHGDLTFQINKANSRSEPKATSAVLSPPSGTSSGRGPYSTPAIVLSPCPEDGRLAGETVGSKSLDVRMFIMTDVVVIGRTLTKPRSSGAQWKLVSDVGTSRVLSVTPPNTLSEPASVELSLLPLKQTDLQLGMIPDDRNVVTVRLSAPLHMTKEEIGAMVDALRRCYAHTLRSLSFPSHSGQYLPHGPHVDLEQDTQKSVMSILNSGLPLPKSPSIQLADPGRAGTADPANDHDREREERGWWSLRFQQVLKEVQRQDPMMSIQTFATPRMT